VRNHGYAVAAARNCCNRVAGVIEDIQSTTVVEMRYSFILPNNRPLLTLLQLQGLLVVMGVFVLQPTAEGWRVLVWPSVILAGWAYWSLMAHIQVEIDTLRAALAERER